MSQPVYVLVRPQMGENIGGPAPLDMAIAFWFGQPSRGDTIRIRSSPKFHFARAAPPMFSPI